MRTAPDWSTTPLARRKYDRNAVELPRYADIERRFKRTGRGLVAAYENGDLTEGQFISRFRDALRDSETHAFVAGRRARGIASEAIGQGEADMLTGRFSRNMRYAHNFARDIKNGRGRMDYYKRVDLYGNSLWSVYSRAETVDWDDPNKNARYFWVLDPDAEHCPTCIENAKQSRDNKGFSWEDMATIGWPGERTLCGVKCRCHVRTKNVRRVDPDRAMAAEPSGTAGGGFDAYQALVGEDYSIPMPASGLPMVRTHPDLIQEAQKIGTHAQALPVVPKTLLQPKQVQTIDDNLRLYIGDGISAWVARNPEDGLWYVFSLILGKGLGLW